MMITMKVTSLDEGKKFCLSGRKKVYYSCVCHYFTIEERSVNCTDIHCFAATNIHQVDVSWFVIFCIEELTGTFLFLTDIHRDKSCFLRLFIAKLSNKITNNLTAAMFNLAKLAKKMSCLKKINLADRHLANGLLVR